MPIQGHYQNKRTKSLLTWKELGVFAPENVLTDQNDIVSFREMTNRRIGKLSELALKRQIKEFAKEFANYCS